jgi:hypothetical protein
MPTATNALCRLDRHFAALVDRQHSVTRGLRQVERVAVVGQVRRDLRRDQAASAGTIDHHDLLFPQLGQPVRDDPGDHVRAVAGCRRRHKRHRFGRIVLRSGRLHAECGEQDHR